MGFQHWSVEARGAGVVSGCTADTAGGEAEDREVQVPGGHDVQPGGQAHAQMFCCQCPWCE